MEVQDEAVSQDQWTKAHDEWSKAREEAAKAE